MAGPSDLSGVWYGRWSSEDSFIYPGSFIALLEDLGGSLSGTVTEPDPEDGGIARAWVAGRRSGSTIEWTKQYDGSGRMAHAVFYSGQVNGEGTEIAGSWRLEMWSGSFAMQREAFTEEELEAEEEIVLLPGGGLR